MLVLEEVCKSFQEGGETRRICDELSLDLAAGEKIAIFGRSGTGKSTLMNLMCGIDVPDSGHIFIDQQPFHDVTDQQRTLIRRQSMGVVFQFFNLIPTLTVIENILLPLSLNHQLTSATRQNAQAQLMKLGLGKQQDVYPEQLSGGEQQRVAVARALVHQPKVVLADEPTGNLDPDTAELVLTMLLELVEQRGSSLVLVSHSEQVVPYVDRVLEMRQGKLVSC